MIESYQYKDGDKTAEAERTLPYVVSGDIKILLGKWASKKGFRLPNNNCFFQTRTDFGNTMKNIFPSFEYIDEEEIKSGLKKNMKDIFLLPVSIDDVYYQTSPGLDITRAIDIVGQDRGLVRRVGSASLLSQFRSIRDSGVKEVVILDDVAFSGNLLERVIDILQRAGINVPLVCVGVAIQEAVDKLEKRGIEVRAVRSYPDVIDEICERDFYPGVPMSGRLVDRERNVGAPYILPFGNPGKWASIPQSWQKELSVFCIEQSIGLFSSIEDASDRPVLCYDIDRKVIGMPIGESRFVDELVKIRNNL